MDTADPSWPPGAIIEGSVFGSSRHPLPPTLYRPDGETGAAASHLRVCGGRSPSPHHPTLRRGKQREFAKAETAGASPSRERAPARPARPRAAPREGPGFHPPVSARPPPPPPPPNFAGTCRGAPPPRGRPRPRPWPRPPPARRPPSPVDAGRGERRAEPGVGAAGWGSPRAQPPRELPRPSGGGPASLPPAAPPPEPRHGALRMRRGAGAGLRARSGVVSAAPRAPARAPRRGHAVAHLARDQGHPGGAVHLRHSAHPVRDPLVHLPRCGLRPRHLSAAGPVPRRAEGRPGARHGGRGASRRAPPPRPRAPPRGARRPRPLPVTFTTDRTERGLRRDRETLVVLDSSVPPVFQVEDKMP
ncbi:serine/arginine repetitive matrix protein 1-like [Bos indicus]|uniref:Serine/arginine repetitive matrix protein 1-like n=1 Tax=Bos indicus TaxID=9915 RepID=A0ABM4S086_BOSIN